MVIHEKKIDRKGVKFFLILFRTFLSDTFLFVKVFTSNYLWSYGRCSIKKEDCFCIWRDKVTEHVVAQCSQQLNKKSTTVYTWTLWEIFPTIFSKWLNSKRISVTLEIFRNKSVTLIFHEIRLASQVLLKYILNLNIRVDLFENEPSDEKNVLFFLTYFFSYCRMTMYSIVPIILNYIAEELQSKQTALINDYRINSSIEMQNTPDSFIYFHIYIYMCIISLPLC